MTRTIIIQGREYKVVDEPGMTGEIVPHLYNRWGRPAGALIADFEGQPVLIGAPRAWLARDISSAVEQLLA